MGHPRGYRPRDCMPEIECLRLCAHPIPRGPRRPWGIAPGSPRLGGFAGEGGLYPMPEIIECPRYMYEVGGDMETEVCGWIGG